jgi:hypothetical protein
MVIAIIAVAAAVSAIPVIAALLVSMASIQEDRAMSLHRRPQGPAQALARRLVGFHCESHPPRPATLTELSGADRTR